MLRRWSFRIVTASGVPLLLLLGLEAGLRLGGYGVSTGASRPCTVGGAKAICDNPEFTARFFTSGLRRVGTPWSIPPVKEPGTFRIFVLGESAAGGDPAPAFGFSRFLEVMLRERFPTVRFELVNTAITAINSHVLAPMARDLARLDADLFLVYAGNNEVVGPFGPGTVLTPKGASLPVIRAGIALRSTRVGQLLAETLRPRAQEARQRWRGMEMFLDRQVAADDPALERVRASFATNLRDVIGAARRTGARVVVSTVGANLRDCAPFASLHRPDLPPEGLAAWEDLARRADVLEHDGQPGSALDLLLAADRIDDRHAALHYRIARLLLGRGDVAGARERFERARELDALRFRPDRGIDQAIRAAAAAGDPGVELVDGAATLADASPDGLPGRELFWEHVHLRPAGNYLLARALLPAVVRAMPPALRGAEAPGEVLSQAESERRLALTAHERRAIAAEVLRRMERPPFTNQLDHAEQLRAITREVEGEPAPVDPARIVEEYRWAVERNPDDRLLNLQLGLFLKRHELDGAEVHLERARATDGSRRPRDVYDH